MASIIWMELNGEFRHKSRLSRRTLEINLGVEKEFNRYIIAKGNSIEGVEGK